MYGGGYTCSSALSVRAKRSILSSYLSEDTRTTSTGAGNSLITVRGFSVNPRVLYRYYYLRQYALVQWCPPPPRRLVHCRSTELYGCYCRGARCCCCYSGGGIDGRYREMIGFLAEGEGVGAGRSAGECTEVRRLSRKENLLSGNRRKETKVNCHSESLEVGTSDGFLDDNECQGRTETRDGGVSRNRTQTSEEGRKFSERRSDAVVQSDLQRRYGSRREELVKSEVRGKQKKDASSLWNSTSHDRKEEEHIQSEIRRIRDERKKLSKMSEVRKETSEGNEEKNEQISSLALELLEEVKRQRIEIDQLNKNYNELLVERAGEDHTKRKSVLNVASSSKEEERENVISSSIVKLVEELSKQRLEIDRLIRSYQVVNNSTEIHETDTERVSSSNKVSVSRIKDVQVSKTSKINLIDTENTHHDQEMNYQKITESSRKNETQIQQDSSTDKILISKCKNINESSTSDINIENRSTQQNRYSDHYTDNDYLEFQKTSELHTIDTHGASTSNEMTIASSTDKDLTSTSSGTLVEEVRLVNHSGKDNIMLTRLSAPHEVVAHKASNRNNVLFTSAKDRENSSISSSNLFEDRRQKEISSCQSNKGSKLFTKSATMHEIDTQRTVTLNKIVDTSSVNSQESSSDNKEMIQHEVSKGNRLFRVSPEMHEIDAHRLPSRDNMMFSISGGREDISFSGALIDEHVPQINSSHSRKDDENLRTTQIHEVASKEISNSKMQTSLNSRYGVEMLDSALKHFEESMEQQQGISEELEKDANEFQPGKVPNLYLTSDSRPDSNDSISEFSLNLTKGKEQQYYAHEENIGGAMLISPKSNQIAEVDERIANSPTLSTKDTVDHQGNYFSMVRSDYQVSEEEGRIEVLESARRLDQSSSRYVGEFLDKLHEENLVSDDSDATSKYSSGIDIDIISNRNGETANSLTQSPDDDLTTGFPNQTSVDSAGKIKSQTLMQETHTDSASSEGKGPSDELWNVTVPSSKESSQEDRPEKEKSLADVQQTAVSANSGNVIKRSSRSFWNIIAEVIRMGWITRAGSGKSTPQSRTRRSTNESASTDTFFSGHEQEEDGEHADKRRHATTNMATVMHQGETSKQKLVMPHMEGSKLMSYEIEGGSVPIEPIDMLMSSNSEMFTLDESSEVAMSSSLKSVVVPSVPVSSSQLPRFKSTQDTAGFHSSNMQNDGSLESEDLTVGSKLHHVSEKEQKDGDLRRRKFQRNKQVLREQFEEWEDAHKLEIEQRKTDEFFMREALLEARKAAEAWEVPIGAVLVQNGSIIARGSNLVEELRDSTAHAEMICIREASNVLRTWRLSDTTLYVTLEPCPMCAGAILQARIDTVVWGAPNKLLGADGSWVRLFPGGDEGQDILGQSSRMAAGPVHPFHPKIKIRRGILSTECSEAMQQFFQRRRKKGKEEEEPQPPCLPITTYPTKLATKLHHIFTMMFCL